MQDEAMIVQDETITPVSASPLPQKAMEDIKMLTFPEAIVEITNGKKVTKLEWSNKNIYGVLKDGLLILVTEGVDHTWTVNDGDLRGTDWFIIPEGI